MLYVLMLLCVLVRGHHGVSLRVSDRGQWFLGVSFRPHHGSESAGFSHVLKLRRSSQSGYRSSEGPLPQHPHLRAQGPEQSNTIRIYGVLCMRGGEGHREMTGSEKKGDVLNSHWFLHYGNYFALFGWREYWKSCRTILNRSVIDYKEPQDEECYWVFC